jgi:hypothetical protein
MKAEIAVEAGIASVAVRIGKAATINRLEEKATSAGIIAKWTAT